MTITDFFDSLRLPLRQPVCTVLLPNLAKDRKKARAMVAAQKLDIFGRFLAAHAVPDDLKDALEAGGRNDMQQLFGHGIAESIRIADGFHVLICVFDLDAHKLIHKIVKARTVRRNSSRCAYI